MPAEPEVIVTLVTHPQAFSRSREDNAALPARGQRGVGTVEKVAREIIGIRLVVGYSVPVDFPAAGRIDGRVQRIAE